MITSAKNYTRKKKEKRKKRKKWTVRTLGQMVKAKLFRQNHTKKHHIHTHKKEKKMHMYIKKLKKEECNQINKSTNDNKL